MAWEQGDVFLHVYLQCVCYTVFVDCSIYLRTFLRTFYSHHIVSEKLLEELHLPDAEVEIQAAGHVHLQRVTTNHHLLDKKRNGAIGANEYEYAFQT